MPKNKVQFQRGMGLREFMDRYGTPEQFEQAEQALFAWRWLRGFACPECGRTGGYRRRADPAYALPTRKVG